MSCRRRQRPVLHLRGASLPALGREFLEDCTRSRELERVGSGSSTATAGFPSCVSRTHQLIVIYPFRPRAQCARLARRAWHAARSNPGIGFDSALSKSLAHTASQQVQCKELDAGSATTVDAFYLSRSRLPPQHTLRFAFTSRPTNAANIRLCFDGRQLLQRCGGRAR